MSRIGFTFMRGVLRFKRPTDWLVDGLNERTAGSRRLSIFYNEEGAVW